MADIEKLRKFALLAALLLFSFSVAGVQLDPGVKVSIFGVPFKIASPDLLPVGLVALSVYGLIRYYYYAMMLGPTPYRQRKVFLHTLHAEGGHGVYKGSIFLGPSKFSTTSSAPEELEPKVGALTELFPKVGTFSPRSEIKPIRVTDEDGEELVRYKAEISVPLPCYLAAVVQDIDYTAPVWANLVALGIAAMRTLV